MSAQAQLDRRSLLAAAAALAGAAVFGRSLRAQAPLSSRLLTGKLRDDAAAAVSRGIVWLLKQQLPDGGWHSITYGGLRDGAAVTSLAIWTLSRLPNGSDQPQDKLPLADSPELSGVVEEAAKFLALGFERRSTIASPDGSLDYPTYAAAHILEASRRFPALEKELPREALVHYLVQAQAAKSRSFQPESPDYGGWDLLGEEDATGITTGTNVSVTSIVLDALAPVKGEAVQQACELARDWVHRAQDATPDGGFAFTPEIGSLNNKAQWVDEARTRARSYGSATSDGLRALVALEGAQERIERAVQWLVDHPSVEIVPGFDDLPPELGWRDGLRFYYAQSLARVLTLLPEAIARDRAEKMARWLLKEQAAGGQWRNASARMREDDPLISTPFCVTALVELLRSNDG
jgi:hypothetical protein